MAALSAHKMNRSSFRIGLSLIVEMIATNHENRIQFVVCINKLFFTGLSKIGHSLVPSLLDKVVGLFSRKMNI